MKYSMGYLIFCVHSRIRFTTYSGSKSNAHPFTGVDEANNLAPFDALASTGYSTESTNYFAFHHNYQVPT